MTTKHTQGPWTIEANGVHTIGAAGAGHIAHVSARPLAGDGKANARLIAAAPELLEALEIIKLNFDEGRAMAPGTPSYHMLCEVIAKATGAEP